MPIIIYQKIIASAVLCCAVRVIIVYCVVKRDNEI
jgi:hypothetical protein